jgi:hypothetical protein
MGNNIPAANGTVDLGKIVSWVVLGVVLVGLGVFVGVFYSEDQNRTTRIILTPLLWAGIFVTLGGLVIMFLLKDNPDFTLFTKTHTATWDFSKSWASITTVAGATLTGILSASSFFDEESDVPKQCLALSLFFAFLVILAPVLYNVVQIWDETNKGPRGFVVLYLLASTVVLWAAFGQLSTVQYLVENTKDLPQQTISTFQVMLAVAQVAFVIYSLFRMYSAVREQLIPEVQSFGFLLSERGNAIRPNMPIL